MRNLNDFRETVETGVNPMPLSRFSFLFPALDRRRYCSQKESCHFLHIKTELYKRPRTELNNNKTKPRFTENQF